MYGYDVGAARLAVQQRDLTKGFAGIHYGQNQLAAIIGLCGYFEFSGNHHIQGIAGFTFATDKMARLDGAGFGKRQQRLLAGRIKSCK